MAKWHSLVSQPVVHPIVQLSYPDATDRAAGTNETNGKVAGVKNINGVAQQLDTGSYWILESIGPLVWRSLLVGTATALTPTSVLFAGAAGEVTDDGVNFIWNSAVKRLEVGAGVPGNITAGLYVKDGLEVDGTAFFDALTTHGGISTFNSAIISKSSLAKFDNTYLSFGSSNDAVMSYRTIQTPNTWMFGVSAESNGMIICELADININFSQALQSNPTIFIQSADATTPTQFISFAHNQTDGVINWGVGELSLAGGNVRANGIVYTTTALRGATSLWYHYRQISALDISPGASGAVFTPPSANTLGGYQLDVSTEYLYFGADVHNDWDGATDVIVEVFFEVNIDNSGGGAGDTVDLQLLCYMKGDAETACKLQTLEEAIVVGQSPQYKQFRATFTIDYDDGSDPVQVDDVFSMRLNLETDTSEVDNVIINHFEFKYLSAQPNAIEV